MPFAAVEVVGVFTTKIFGAATIWWYNAMVRQPVQGRGASGPGCATPRVPGPRIAVEIHCAAILGRLASDTVAVTIRKSTQAAAGAFKDRPQT